MRAILLMGHMRTATGFCTVLFNSQSFMWTKWVQAKLWDVKR